MKKIQASVAVLALLGSALSFAAENSAPCVVDMSSQIEMDVVAVSQILAQKGYVLNEGHGRSDIDLRIFMEGDTSWSVMKDVNVFFTKENPTASEEARIYVGSKPGSLLWESVNSSRALSLIKMIPSRAQLARTGVNCN